MLIPTNSNLSIYIIIKSNYINVIQNIATGRTRTHAYKTGQKARKIVPSLGFEASNRGGLCFNQRLRPLGHPDFSIHATQICLSASVSPFLWARVRVPHLTPVLINTWKNISLIIRSRNFLSILFYSNLLSILLSSLIRL